MGNGWVGGFLVPFSDNSVTYLILQLEEKKLPRYNLTKYPPFMYALLIFSEKNGPFSITFNFLCYILKLFEANGKC